MTSDVNDSSMLTVQQQLPFAFVRGEAVIEKPEDLYIPPEALEIILEAFEGPLDLLLYLIKKQKFDIVDLPIRQITEQYMEYVEVMKDLNLELAAEYLVMAAILAEIKSRLLLPKTHCDDETEQDPRAELIKRLQEYEVFKLAAVSLDAISRDERDFFYEAVAVPEDCQPDVALPEINLQDLVLAFSQVLKQADHFKHHHITPETLSTRERMALILEKLQQGEFMPFSDFFDVEEGPSGVVVTFLAILELVKEHYIEVIQNKALSDVHIRMTFVDIEST